MAQKTFSCWRVHVGGRLCGKLSGDGEFPFTDPQIPAGSRNFRHGPGPGFGQQKAPSVPRSAFLGPGDVKHYAKKASGKVRIRMPTILEETGCGALRLERCLDLNGQIEWEIADIAQTVAMNHGVQHLQLIFTSISCSAGRTEFRQGKMIDAIQVTRTER